MVDRIPNTNLEQGEDDADAMVTELDDLMAVWRRIGATLPPGWQLDSLRCASTGLAPDQRSDEWIAIAIGPRDEERRSEAADPIAALDGLVTSTPPSNLVLRSDADERTKGPLLGPRSPGANPRP